LQLEVERLKGWVNPADAFLALHSKDQNAFWLDRSTNQSEPVSIIGSAGSVIRLGDEAFQIASDHLQRIRAAVGEKGHPELPFSFRPGLVGYLGYELGSGARESVHPKAQLMMVDRAMVFDHRTKQMYFIGLFDSKADFSNWYQAALLRLALVGGELAAFMQNTSEPMVSSVRLRHSKESYLELIQKAKSAIQKGDSYQLCLTNQIIIEHQANALKAFLTLREANPAPYSAYLKFGGLEIVSSSPEQFLKVLANGSISSKPIKGTRPRGQNRDVDAKLAAELLANEKERAENLMIVDLMRNDFGKVCEPETVVVEKLFEVESYSSVHQLVSTVTGKLRPGISATSALAACFPAGSMTGAPKQKAMEILADLEKEPRGIYSGALGFLGFDGSADFGMTIRTLVFEGQYASLGVGGGLTIDSDPEEEYLETLLKAKVLLSAIGGSSWKI
jgi:para-aminobenzoate synthetase component I